VRAFKELIATSLKLRAAAVSACPTNGPEFRIRNQAKESRTLVSPALKHAAVFSDSEEMNGRKGQMPNLADANPWPPAIWKHHNSLLEVRQYSKPCSHH
jgi:hypothetical protein